ncbi:MAG: FHA domain-containing protein [Candidatus Lindowbacteria bacterium]|nr:FHA domain-containing protein [Candidatus Lindowbacteria bacterium]
MAVLKLVFGRDVLQTYDMDKGKMLIGRAEDCDVVIDNLAVSRHHAMIEKKEGVFTINDLDSNNGTFVNGQRIEKPAALNFGDEIGVGKHILVFESSVKKAQTTPVSSVAGALPDMDLPERGTMFVEPEKMQRIQKKVSTAGRAHLLTKGVSDPKGMMPLEKSDIVFGKAEDCDVKIKGFFASRRHAILSRLEKGFQLTNLAVLSPTRVNGTRIESSFLVDGDEIAMGKSKFIFRSER